MHKTKPEAVYIVDNGATYCGEHLGASAAMTGRDISGQEIMEITPPILSEARSQGWEPKCETCGRRPSSLYLS